MKNLKTMKFLFAICMLLLATSAFAKGTPGVVNGVHNLSATGVDPFFKTVGSSLYRTNVDEVCVFCHTPHSGSLAGPLWNRSNPGNDTFTHYNSATLSTYIKGLTASRIVNDESLLCLACHDGSVSVNHLLNKPNSMGATAIATWNGGLDTEIQQQFGKPGARIGGSLTVPGDTGDLSDDHPISFSYDQVLLSAEYIPAGPKNGDLRDVATATTWGGEGVRFFGTDNRVECSSCHDPHVDYLTDASYTPFLIRPNSGSNLCLACHNK